MGRSARRGRKKKHDDIRRLARINEHPGFPSYQQRLTGCHDCKKSADHEKHCGDGCMWAKFDPLAHDCAALWARCRKYVGKNQVDAPVFALDYEALGAYLAAGGPLVDDHEAHEVLDGMVVFSSVKSG